MNKELKKIDYERIISNDIDSLMESMPSSPARRHIEQVLRDSIDFRYPPNHGLLEEVKLFGDKLRERYPDKAGMGFILMGDDGDYTLCKCNATSMQIECMFHNMLKNKEVVGVLVRVLNGAIKIKL